MLIALGGLPGSGKSTLAREMAMRTGAIWLRIDSIEQAMRDSGYVDDEIGPAGYFAAAAAALDNLRLGRLVIVDSVNPIPVTRETWAKAAPSAGVKLVEVEVVCSDRREHRRRVETRHADVPGLRLPDWATVCAREYVPWPGVIVVDTAGRGIEACVAQVLRHPGLVGLQSG